MPPVRSDWIRSTRACSLGDLPPPLHGVLMDRARKHEIGDLQAMTVGCWETISRRSKRRLFGLLPPRTVTMVTATVLTSGWLIIVIGDGVVPTGVLVARTAQIEATDNDRNLIDDLGVQLWGTFIGHERNIGYTLWVGPERDGEGLIEAIKAAVRAAHGA